jgi:hypothetical protein
VPNLSPPGSLGGRVVVPSPAVSIGDSDPHRAESRKCFTEPLQHPVGKLHGVHGAREQREVAGAGMARERWLYRERASQRSQCCPYLCDVDGSRNEERPSCCSTVGYLHRRNATTSILSITPCAAVAEVSRETGGLSRLWPVDMDRSGADCACATGGVQRRVISPVSIATRFHDELDQEGKRQIRRCRHRGGTVFSFRSSRTPGPGARRWPGSPSRCVGCSAAP